MNSKENEAAVLAHNDPQASKPTNIVANFDAAVKRNDLRAVIDAVDLAPKEAARYLREYFPSLDKTIISKCSRPDKYGCVLHPHGYEVLREKLRFDHRIPPTLPDVSQETTPQPPCGGSGVMSPEATTTPRKSRGRSDHRYTSRVAGRLPDDKFLQLQRYIRMEGYETTQDWVTAQVDAFIEKMEAKYGLGS